MSNMKIAAQLYTLREHLETPEDVEKSLKKVKAMGYNAVQVSGLGPIDPERLKKIVNKNDLKICATHVSYDRLQNELDEIIKEHKLWDCKYVGLGAMPQEYSDSEAGFKKFAKNASEIARNLKKSGLQFIYHNHNFEFAKFGDKIGLEILYEETDSEVFDFEIDTYWVQAGGGDPVKWIKKMKDRMKVVHFKDMTVEGWKPIMAEVGEGNLNWSAIIEACDNIGVEWCAVEQDECQRSPFESLEISLNNLKDMGLKV
ncbi:MAG: sugar phosphate isomerase/epimerase family protein [Halanaerobiales bacterium]